MTTSAVTQAGSQLAAIGVRPVGFVGNAQVTTRSLCSSIERWSRPGAALVIGSVGVGFLEPALPHGLRGRHGGKLWFKMRLHLPPHADCSPDIETISFNFASGRSDGQRRSGTATGDLCGESSTAAGFSEVSAQATATASGAASPCLAAAAESKLALV